MKGQSCVWSINTDTRHKHDIDICGHNNDLRKCKLLLNVPHVSVSMYDTRHTFNLKHRCYIYSCMYLLYAWSSLILFYSSQRTHTSVGSRQEKCKMISKFRGSTDDKVSNQYKLRLYINIIWTIFLSISFSFKISHWLLGIYVVFRNSPVKEKEVSSEISKYIHW
jgi:hypothetical protein